MTHSGVLITKGMNWTELLADIENVLDDNLVENVREENVDVTSEHGEDAFIHDHLKNKNMSEGVNTLADVKYYLEKMGQHLDMEEEIR